ncbi:MAG: hypothetical protein KAT70_08290 [Thermoplasmata archaeon]|nr:hypothetical protein [Thermoplasmata archaeon]
MAKEKITISVDERVLGLIDRQRGDTKRSTYINSALEEFFHPRAPEDKGGGTFVTTLELRKTLKNVHDRLGRMEALESTIRDLEYLVYDSLYDVKEKRVKTKRGGVPTVPMGIAPDPELIARVDKWMDKVLKEHGNIAVDRDFGSFLKLKGVEQSVLAMTRHLRRKGLEFDQSKRRWS